MKKNSNAVINTIVVIISIILGVVVAIFYSISLVTALTRLLKLKIIFSTIFLMSTVMISLLPRGKQEHCVYNYGPLVVAGALGAILFSSITLSLTVSSLALSILVGIITVFAIIELCGFFLFVMCIVKNNCRCRD